MAVGFFEIVVVGMTALLLFSKELFFNNNGK